MRRFPRIRVQYLAAAALAVGIGGGIYALRGSQANAPAPATAPLVASPRQASTVATASTVVQASSMPWGSRKSTVPRKSTAPPTRPKHESVPSALALLARARLAYAHVPAVVVAGTLVRARLRLTFILHDDRIVADGWLGTGANGEIIGAVTPARSPTFARELGTRCWRPLAKSNVLSSTDIGAKFPPALPGPFGPPVRSRGGWVITGEDSNGALTVLDIDAKTFKLRSLTSSQSGLSFTGSVDALSSVPALPVPEPRC